VLNNSVLTRPNKNSLLDDIICPWATLTTVFRSLLNYDHIVLLHYSVRRRAASQLFKAKGRLDVSKTKKLENQMEL
jgi:hypothetical protein